MIYGYWFREREARLKSHGEGEVLRCQNHAEGETPDFPNGVEMHGVGLWNSLPLGVEMIRDGKGETDEWGVKKYG